MVSTACVNKVRWGGRRAAAGVWRRGPAAVGSPRPPGAPLRPPQASAAPLFSEPAAPAPSTATGGSAAAPRGAAGSGARTLHPSARPSCTLPAARNPTHQAGCDGHRAGEVRWAHKRPGAAVPAGQHRWVGRGGREARQAAPAPRGVPTTLPNPSAGGRSAPGALRDGRRSPGHARGAVGVVGVLVRDVQGASRVKGQQQVGRHAAGDGGGAHQHPGGARPLAGGAWRGGAMRGGALGRQGRQGIRGWPA